MKLVTAALEWAYEGWRMNVGRGSSKSCRTARAASYYASGSLMEQIPDVPGRKSRRRDEDHADRTRAGWQSRPEGRRASVETVETAEGTSANRHLRSQMHLSRTVNPHRSQTIYGQWRFIGGMS